MSVVRRKVLGARGGAASLRDQTCCANQSRPAAREGRRKGSRRSKAVLVFLRLFSLGKIFRESENDGLFRAKCECSDRKRCRHEVGKKMMNGANNEAREKKKSPRDATHTQIHFSESLEPAI